jgi:hypothetical protein
MKRYAKPFAVILRLPRGQSVWQGAYDRVTIEGGEVRGWSDDGSPKLLARFDGTGGSWRDTDGDPLMRIDITPVLMGWEREEQLDLLALYMAGEYRQLCERYCHEGWEYSLSDDGRLIEAGICSYSVTEGTEEEALAAVANHIHQEVLQGVLGC